MDRSQNNSQNSSQNKLQNIPQNKPLMLQTGKGAYRVCRLEDIVVITIHDHLCSVFLAGKTDCLILVATSLSQIMDGLPADMFCRVNRSTIVNVWQVDRFEGERLTLTDGRYVEVPADSTYRDEFLQRYSHLPA